MQEHWIPATRRDSVCDVLNELPEGQENMSAAEEEAIWLHTLFNHFLHEDEDSCYYVFCRMNLLTELNELTKASGLATEWAGITFLQLLKRVFVVNRWPCHNGIKSVEVNTILCLLSSNCPSCSLAYWDRHRPTTRRESRSSFLVNCALWVFSHYFKEEEKVGEEEKEEGFGFNWMDS